MNEAFNILEKHNVFVKSDYLGEGEITIVTYSDDAGLKPAIAELIDFCEEKGYELTLSIKSAKTMIVISEGEAL